MAENADLTQVEVMHTAGCPTVGALIEFLEHREDVVLVTTEVSADRPAPTGFCGSPTVLIDGIELFGRPEVEAAACSLHPPSVRDVEQGLLRSAGRTDPDRAAAAPGPSGSGNHDL